VTVTEMTAAPSSLGGPPRGGPPKMRSPADDPPSPASDLHAARFRAVLGAMTQGVSCFDTANRLVACNERYAEIYGLRLEHVRPGTALREIMQRRHAVGSAPPTSPPEYLEWGGPSADAGPSEDGLVTLGNGKIIAVRHHRMGHGGWLATHEDITDRRLAERRAVHAAIHDGLAGPAEVGAFITRTPEAASIRAMIHGESSPAPDRA
jgi:hypothetical protein